MDIGVATADDFSAFLQLAAEVEHLFGPMVNEEAFHDTVRRNISRGTALLARDPLGAPSGGLLFSPHRHPSYVVGWLVVADEHRSKGFGQALMAEAFRRWVRPPCTVEVVAFGPDHPRARSRRFYERLGFRSAEQVERGPEGGSRQVLRMHLEGLPEWARPASGGDAPTRRQPDSDDQSDGTASQPVDLVIALEDPRTADVRALLETHLAFSRTVTPIDYSFALDLDGLLGPSVTFFAARRGGELVGVGALKHLDPIHGEIKSMHTREDVRGQGIGRAMVGHLLGFARGQGYQRVSLETGSTSDFASARALYAKAGLRPCGPFGDYRASAYNTFMTIDLDDWIRPEARHGVVDSAEVEISGVRLWVETLLTDEAPPTELVTTGFCLAFDRSSRLLMIRLSDRDWHPTGGHREAHETPEEAAIREVKEEGGCEVGDLCQIGVERITRLSQAPADWPYPSSTGYQVIFVGRLLTDDPRAGAEAIAARLFSEIEARRTEWVKAHEAFYTSALELHRRRLS